MVAGAQIGELVVGAYHEFVTEADVVSYNRRSDEQGDQMELDVLAVDNTDGKQTVYACEVVTHLSGRLYSGTPDTDDWDTFGNDSYQYSLETLWRKFEADYEYVQDVFDDADEYVLQFWSPYVPKGYLTDGLDELSMRFEEKHGIPVARVINEKYTGQMDKLEKKAADETAYRDQPVFRLLQIQKRLR